MTDRCLAPDPDFEDPAALAAWYSGWALWETYRKVVLAQCKELIRAKYQMANQKISETRIDDLARNHDIYLEYLLKHLHGRQMWEREVLAANGGQMGAR